MTLDEYLSQPDVVGKQLADEIGIPPPLLAQWRYPERVNGRHPPVDRCPTIEQATDGAVTCEELRPDIRWVRIPDKKWPNVKGRPLVDHAKKAA